MIVTLELWSVYVYGGGCVCVLGMCVFVSVDVFLDVYVCGVGLVRGMGVTDTTLVATTASHHLRAWELKAWVTLWSSDVHRLYEVHTSNVRCTPTIWVQHSPLKHTQLLPDMNMNFLRCPRLISKVTWKKIQSILRTPHTAQAWTSVVTFAYRQTLQAPPVHRRLAFKTWAFWTHFLSENPASLFICEFVIFNLQYLTLLRNIYICLLFLILNPVCPKSRPPLIGRPPLFLHHPSLQLVLIPRENSRMSFLGHILYIWDTRFKNIPSIIECSVRILRRESVQHNFTDFISPNLQSPVWGNFLSARHVTQHTSSATFFFLQNINTTLSSFRSISSL